MVAVCPASSSLLRLRGVGGSTPSLQPREDGAGFCHVAGTGAQDGASVRPPCPQAGSGNRDPWPLGTSRLCPWDTVPRTDKPGGLGTKQTARTGTPRLPPPLESRRPLPRPQWGADEGPGPLHAPRRAKQTHDTSTSRDLGALGRRSDGDDGRFGERERHLSEKGQWPPGHHENATGRARALACAQGGPSRFLLPPATWWGVEGDGKRPQGHPVGCGVRPHSGQEGGSAARWMNHKPTAKAGPCLCR